MNQSAGRNAIPLKLVGASSVPIPKRHQGLSFDRIRPTVSPCEVSQQFELAFATEWANVNRPDAGTNEILQSLLVPSDTDAQKHLVPKSEREEEIAAMVAATVIQWLGTSSGARFLHDAFRRAGGDLHISFPEKH